MGTTVYHQQLFSPEETFRSALKSNQGHATGRGFQIHRTGVGEAQDECSLTRDWDKFQSVRAFVGPTEILQGIYGFAKALAGRKVISKDRNASLKTMNRKHK